MFRAVLADVELLRKPLEAIAQLIDEGTFKLSKDGIEFIAADRAMIAMVELKMLPTAFEEFEVEGNPSLSLNLENLLDVTKRVGKKDKLVLELKGNKLNLTLTNSSKRRFYLPLLELGEEELPDIKQLEFKCKAEIDASVFKEGIMDASIVSDSIVLEKQANKFLMRAEGDITNAEIEVSEEEGLYSLEGEDSKARYPLDYLKKILKTVGLSDSVILEFSTDYPLKLSLKILDKLSIAFVIAPRVE